MKWNKEKDKLLQFINEGKSYEEIGRMYDVTGSAIRKAAQRLGISLIRRRKINSNETFNKGRVHTETCLYCGKSFERYAYLKGKFCSVECSVRYQRIKHVELWRSGKLSGTKGYTCSSFVRNYMLQKSNFRCERCGWGETNPYTNKVPLQIHHIDGNSENNAESNLQVLCPNCHSLTENFGSRNKNAPKGKSAYYGRAKKRMISLTAQSIPLLKGRVWVGVPYHPHSKPRAVSSSLTSVTLFLVPFGRFSLKAQR